MVSGNNNSKNKRNNLIPTTMLMKQFDIRLHDDGVGDAYMMLQNKYKNFLRSLEGIPARFVTWQNIADLSPMIHHIAVMERHEKDPFIKTLLIEQRRYFEELHNERGYQQLTSGLAVWANESINSDALVRSARGVFGVPTWRDEWPALLRGQYRLALPDSKIRFTHLVPVGSPGGRPYVMCLSSYDFEPVTWNFFTPLRELTSMKYSLAIAVDIPNTYDTGKARGSIEGNMLAQQVHLATTVGVDSRTAQKLEDCNFTLSAFNEGDRLHEAQFIVALMADSKEALAQAVDDAISAMKSHVLLRPEPGQIQLEMVKFFTSTATNKIAHAGKTFPLLSRDVALTFGLLGTRKMDGLKGTMRGQSLEGSYPFFYNSWPEEKIASHEIWAGSTGVGKTFALNVFLTRQYVLEGVPFDILEPMGHGEKLATALNLDWVVPSPNATRLNMLDVMFFDMTEQVTHVIRLLEAVLGRQFSGDSNGNIQKALIGEAIKRLYDDIGPLADITPNRAPIISNLCSVLKNMGDNQEFRDIAQRLGLEIQGVCTGSGPYAAFLNARTNVDLSYRQGGKPRIFSFHKMATDEKLLAIAYTQVLSAIRRDCLADDSPRTVAVDEFYRLQRHPSLVDFLIEGAKTFRTRRVKLIVIDQNLSVFTNDNARLLLENCPIRVIFKQQSVRELRNDEAFERYTEQHIQLIGSMPPRKFLIDIDNYGIFLLENRVSDYELSRFQGS